MPGRSWSVLLVATLFVVLARGLGMAENVVLRGASAIHRGTVVEQTASSVTIRFPRDEIAWIGADSAQPPADLVAKEAEDRTTLIQLTRGQFDDLKADIRRQVREEIRSEFERQRLLRGTESPGASRPADPTPPPPSQTDPTPVSPDPFPRVVVRGRLLTAGTPVGGLQVQVLEIRDAIRIFGIVEKVTYGEEHHATTDAMGEFEFRGLPDGEYRVKWQNAGDSAWQRQADPEPELSVAGDGTYRIADIDTRFGVPRH